MARTSRWDRPPLPKDVRWGVRLFGKVLIGTGLLMFGFVAYQLWGTGIEYARAQNRLDGRFDELMEANGVDPDFDPFETPALPTTLAQTTAAPTTTLGPTPASNVSGQAPADTSTVAPTTTSAPTTTAATTTTPTPSSTAVPHVLDWSYVDEEQFVGQLWIPSIGIEGSNAQNVVQGVAADALKDGPGHYPDTPFPGELGNAAIAGHRTTYGAPFHDLPDVEIGDEIAFLLPDGRRYVYRMTGSETVNPGDGHVVATTDTTKATLTLTTCTPVGTAAQRYILYAEFVPELSSPVGAYVPRRGDGTTVLPGEGGEAAAAEPTIAASTEPATTAPAPASTVAATAGTAPATSAALDDPVVSTSPATTDAPGTDPPTSTAPAADEAGSEGGDGRDDAFSSHWFDDKAAFPQVALWAAIATAVVVSAYLLARRFRNSWIGLAVGVAPFLVTLYFFYQNVNRLLPAAL